MNSENTVKLLEKYSFVNNSIAYLREEGQSSPFELFLFECEDGWYDLLDRTFGEMQSAAKHPEEIYIAQVKEKWAGLRIYFNCHSDDFESLRFIVDQAEQESYHTCEKCGKKGSMRDLIGYQTLCAKHYKEKKEYYQKQIDRFKKFEKVKEDE
jgi:hypothetical protein